MSEQKEKKSFTKAELKEYSAFFDDLSSVSLVESKNTVKLKEFSIIIDTQTELSFMDHYEIIIKASKAKANNKLVVNEQEKEARRQLEEQNVELTKTQFMYACQLIAFAQVGEDFRTVGIKEYVKQKKNAPIAKFEKK